MSQKNLNGQVTLITGSTRGIGWQTAQLFAQEGATVIINGYRDPALINERVKHLRENYHIPALGICADFGSPDQIQNCYQKIFQEFKKLDILINNAGVMCNALLGMITEEMMAKSFDVNAIGVIQSIQCASRLMQRSGKGSIVNVSSIMGLQGFVGQVVYSATKAAVIGITKSAAKELAPYKIRVNCVAPGMIDTELLAHLSEEQRKEAIANIRLGRIGQAEDVAKSILFLASDQASYITGQVLGVDGGMIA